ncbi:hypothetical protein LOZ66_004300 [Ophidiomyces ophidiicola]|nr:hypothetical protein LOZ66_004300 [Ophidiomyces ophidiicola]
MPPKRKRSDAASDSRGDRETNSNKRVTRLVARTRQVSEHVVKSKWMTLPEPAQTRIKELFGAIELPVLTKQRDEKKRIEAQSALAAVRKTLGKRLPKMPFPPGTKAVNFDYDAALNENRILEGQLAMMTNSAALLRREIKREEVQLARDTAKLAELGKNVKAAKVHQKKQTKNMHPALRRLEQRPLRIEDSANLSVTDAEEKPGLLCDMDDENPDLLSLVKQLRNHLESMQTNAGQVSGVREAITRAQSSLSMLPLG